MEPKAVGARCWECPLRSQMFVPSAGNLDPDAIILVGEAPGAEEVRLQRPFVGQSGQLINHVITNAGYDPDNTWRSNVVACRPPDNRMPTQQEIDCCMPRLVRELKAHPGKRMMTLGAVASAALLPGFSLADRGMWQTFDGKQVMPAWHPAFVLRKPSEMGTLQRDVRVAFEGPKEVAFAKPPVTIFVEDIVQLQEQLARCPEGVRVGFDIETDQVQWYDLPTKKADAILCLQIAWSDEYGIVMDDAMLYDTPGVIPVLQQFFDRKDLIFCGQNAQFDMVFCKAQLGLNIRCDFDTMIAHYCLDENSRHGLKLLAQEEFGLPDYEVELIAKYLNSKGDRYSKIPFDKLSQYGVWDVVVTRALAELYETRLRNEGLYDWPFKNVMMVMHAHYVDMEIRGIRVDIPYLTNAGVLMVRRMGEIAQTMREISGVPGLNPNAPAQLAVIIYDQLHFPVPRIKGVLTRTTAHEAIEPLKGKHPFIDQLLLYRRIAKLNGSYIENMIEFADCNGRVHSQFQITGTEIGRIAMKDPAMLTVPRPGQPGTPGYDPYLDGAMIRGAVIADPGNDFIIVDYSQAELRVAGALANAKFLLDAYRNNEDIHTKVALAMFGPNYTKEDRVHTKMFNFSYVYGGSEYSFAQDQGLPIMIARQFVKDYNRLIPELKQYRVDQYNKLVADGYVSTVFNRRRRFPLITNTNRDEAEKSAVHAPVAGTASDLTQLACCEVRDNGVDAILTVHDSIAAEGDKQHSREIAEYIKEVMEKTAKQYVPEVEWKADPEVRTRWATPPVLS